MLRLLLAEKACVPQAQMLSQVQAQGGVSQAMLAASAGMPASAGLHHEAALQVRHGVTWSERGCFVHAGCQGLVVVHAPDVSCASLAVQHLVRSTACHSQMATLSRNPECGTMAKSSDGQLVKERQSCALSSMLCTLWHVQGCSFEALCTSISNSGRNLSVASH